MREEKEQTPRFFRSDNMDNLRDIANDRIWHDGEQTKLTYIYPIPACASEEGWQSVAKNRNLLDGIPKGELYELGGFWCAKSPQSHIGSYG